ncbi:MAG: VanZ family protein [Phycisphaerae bacterium]
MFCATHFPRPKLPGQIPSEDKLVHFVAFGVLAFLFWRGAESFKRKLSNHFVLFVVVGLIVFSAVDEYLQQFVNRGTSLADWLANLAGIAVALIPLELRRRSAGPSPIAERDRHEP